jgi:short-chain fatty acids transporter
MARASSMPPKLAQIVGEIPLTQTIFRWQSLVCVAVEITVVAITMWMCTPGEGRCRTALSLGVDLGRGEIAPLPKPATPGEWLEHSPILLLPIALMGFAYLIRAVSRASTVSEALNTLDFNNVNLLFLMLGALLHWTPASLMRSVRDAAPATWGVLLQFPFYAGIFGVLTATQLSERMAAVFVRASTPALYPGIILTYSGILGMFVPSGGAKWLIEAPYVLQSARALHIDAGWMVIAYNLGEAVANLLQPFWMLPILALLGLKAREIMGYTYVVAAVLFPVALVLITLLRPV